MRITENKEQNEDVPVIIISLVSDTRSNKLYGLNDDRHIGHLSELTDTTLGRENVSIPGSNAFPYQFA